MDKKVFENKLKFLNMSKKDFAICTKIPYNTILGWSKKNNKIPNYVEAILNLLIEKKLNEKKPISAIELLKKRIENLQETEPMEISKARKAGYKIDDGKITIPINDKKITQPIYVKRLDIVNFIISRKKTNENR